jgi:hypothetical protein
MEVRLGYIRLGWKFRQKGWLDAGYLGFFSGTKYAG